MTTTIGERFAQLIESLGMNENSFAKSIDKSRSMIGFVVSGKSKPGFEFLEVVCKKFPRVSRDWLITGEGEMFKAEQGPSDSYLKEHLHTLEENFNRLASQLEKKDQQLEAADKRAEGLQRTIDGLMGMPGKSIDVPFESRVLPLWPELKKVA